jgi:hypothetical protein
MEHVLALEFSPLEHESAGLGLLVAFQVDSHELDLHVSFVVDSFQELVPQHGDPNQVEGAIVRHQKTE